jgi:hypothetical protein
MAGGEDNNQQPRQPRDMQVSQSCSQAVLWNRNRNHRNRNFLPCGTGTGTVIN